VADSLGMCPSVPMGLSDGMTTVVSGVAATANSADSAVVAVAA
jgi:hypothetical protein